MRFGFSSKLHYCAWLIAGLSGLLSPDPASAMDRCAGEAFAVIYAPGGTTPYIQLKMDDRTGAFLLDYGTTRSSLSQEVFGRSSEQDGGERFVRGFTLPTFAQGRFQLARYGLLREPPNGQLGIIGTDFLSKLTADLVFKSEGSDVRLGLGPCDPDIMRRRGMVAISQADFFSSDASRVRRDLPNVPVLPLRIGGIDVWAQVDTGYDDTVFTPSIDINETLFQRLLASGMDLKPIGKVTVTTCAGSDVRDVYDARKAGLAITSSGAVIQTLKGAYLVRKRLTGCGGIASLSEPAAQIGVSVLRELGSIVFDPKAELVWVPRNAGGAGR